MHDLFPGRIPILPSTRPDHALAAGSRFRFDDGMKTGVILFFVLLGITARAAEHAAPQGYAPSRCELLPLPDDQVAFLHQGTEMARWHFDPKYPRPFFYPFNGPSVVSLTRMGHPGAQNHDHHRSIWFAHAKVEGIDFWSENTKARIRQKHWLAYEDGDEESILATSLGWYDEAGKELIDHELVAASSPDGDGGQFLEIQITLRPGADRDTTTLEKSNFGLLAVRVAKSLSHHFGGGQLTSSEGTRGEEAIFEKTAAWMDYSGPVTSGTGPERKTVLEGITFYDHPGNPRYPTPWHVRSDGWMGASFCQRDPWTIEAAKPLVLRYLLHAHSDEIDPDKATVIAADFGKRPGFVVEKATKPHRQFEARRTAP
jgi:hypothetical protein